MAIEKALALIALKRTEQIGDISDAVETAQGAAEDAQEAAEAAEAALANKADIDGYYANMTVGNAEQLISDDYTTDSVPYNFRTAGGDADIGDREYDELVGGTLAWNQLTYDGNFTSADNWVVTNGTVAVADNVLTMTCNYEEGTTGTNFYLTQKGANKFVAVDGHKYFMCVDAKFSKANTNPIWFRLYHSGSGSSAYSSGTTDYTGDVVADTWYHFAGIAVPARTDTKTSVLLWSRTLAYEAGDTIELKNCMVIDLTQMFGTAIADHVYALETNETGTGVAWFRKLFPKDYYAYSTYTLMSVNAASHDMVGFNQWDEQWEVGSLNADGTNKDSTTEIRSKNYIPVFGGTVCYVKAPSAAVLHFWDASKNYVSNSYSAGNTTFTTPSNAAYMKFRTTNEYGTTYHSDICINLSWSGYRNGEYEAYEKRSYPLDSSLTLRGIPKLDASNNLYYDGDTYASDGTVNRRYGVVDLGALTWNYSATAGHEVFYCSLSSIKPVPTENDKGQMLCMEYTTESQRNVYMQQSDKIISTSPANNNPHRLWIYDSAKMTMTTAEFKASLAGVMLCFELDTPTTETADPFQDLQVVSDFGTEEYVDAGVAAGTRDVAIPVGHETKYIASLVDKLRRLPNAPDSAGNYLINYNATTRRLSCTEYTDGGRITALEEMLPDAPSSDGTYALTCTIADGEATYTWEAQS